MRRRGLPRFALALAFLAAMTGKLPAFDFGILTEGQGSWSSDAPDSVAGSGRAALWTSVRAGSVFKLFGNFALSLDSSSKAPLAAGDILDLRALRADLEFGNLAGGRLSAIATAGRFDFGDPTGFVLAQRADGAALRLASPGFVLLAQGGWFGFQPKTQARISLSADDILDAFDDSVYFAPPRAFGIVSARFPELFARQDGSFFAVYQADARENAKEALNSLYGGLSFRGAITETLYWSAFGLLETTFPDLAYLFGGSVEYFNPEAAALSLRSDFLAASGKTGVFSAYRPVTTTYLGGASKIATSNAFVIGLNASLKLGKKVQPMARAAFLFRMAPTAIAAAGFIASSLDPYTGTEFTASCAVRLLSDSSLTGSFGLFLPNVGGSFADGTMPLMKVELGLGVSL